MRRPTFRVLPALTIALALLLSACGGDDENDVAQTETITETETPSPPADEPTDAATESDDDDDGRSRKACDRIDRTGRIDMAGAGTVRLQRSGDRLSVSNVRPGSGWRARVERDDDGDEVEVTFRGSGGEVELEAELDDGRLRAEVCRKGR
jgi:hypothetical protein